MNINFSRSFEPKEVEEKWYEFWESRGYFKPVNRGKGKFSIVIPPPNVTGSLHMGHAFCFTLHDVIVRWKRMRGFETLWLPGTDHAGIATQNVVERDLLKKGISRKELGRKEFEKKVWEWKEKFGNRIINQLKRLGASCDWGRLRFTLDEGLSRAVKEVFVRLYEEGLIYKGQYIVNWCPRCGTAISDLETVYEEHSGKLYYIKYPIVEEDDFIVIATTRPETMLGDTAVAVNPEDERFVHLKGKKVILPIMNREIPIIEDDYVDVEFGTGLVKVTPSHDPNDYEMGKRHNLPFVKVIGEDGRMTQDAGKYAGMDRFKCREKLLEELKEKGLLLKIEDHIHNVGHCQRCGTVIEPLVSTQWFVKIKPLAQKAIEAVREGRTTFIPKRYEKIYFNWMENIHDWCISRQLWWGHRIPAWYCKDCGKYTVSQTEVLKCRNCGSENVIQEEDVLDTWFSSALWPFSTLGWPDETEDLKKYYPTDLLITGFDIIFFWVARMIMMGLKFMKDVPFKYVYIHGLVRDEHNQKMSKSKGNVIDPLEIMEKYGTDAMRFTLAIMAMPGSDLPFKLDRMVGYRAFANKIWNAARYVLMNLPQGFNPVDINTILDFLEKDSSYFSPADKWILHRLNEVIQKVNEKLEKFIFFEPANELYHFFWHEFCDWYIEISKPILNGSDENRRKVVFSILIYIFDNFLRLLHPFMPFITEEIWQKIPHQGDSIMISPYPVPSGALNFKSEKEKMEKLMGFVISVRNLRAEYDISPREKLSLFVEKDGDLHQYCTEFKDVIKNLAGIENVEFSIPSDREKLLKGIFEKTIFYLSKPSHVDLNKEIEKLEKDIKKAEDDFNFLKKKLDNKNFLEKAPERVVNDIRKKFQVASARLEKLKDQLKKLKER